MYENIISCDIRKASRYDVAWRSGIGKRESQQDFASVLVGDQALFAVLCDGMGGHSDGRLASQTAVEAFSEYFQMSVKSADGMNRAENDWMTDAAEAVDRIVSRLPCENDDQLRPGTTLVSVFLQGDQLDWLSVGDSRVYIVRGDELMQVTSDHNYHWLLEQRLKAHQIDEKTYQKEMVQGDALISYVGMGGLRLIDTNGSPLTLKTGDMLLLCSDGLYRSVSSDEVKLVLSKSPSAKIAAELLEKRVLQENLKDQDNYTYIIIKLIAMEE